MNFDIMANQDLLIASRARLLQPRPTVAAERDFVLSEAHHRISNNLALLSSAIGIRSQEIVNRKRPLSSQEVSLVLGEVSARISAIAWLHRYLSKEPDAPSIDLCHHLRELCETLISALAEPDKVTFVMGNGECMVATGNVVPLCLIVTEVVTNSLKYAHPANVSGMLALGCSRDRDGSLVVEVADDGVGLPEGFDLLTDGGTGARTIRVLARQLEAEVTVESGPIGLHFRRRLPA
jgi:two-component sensor histidine kinase